MHFWLFTSRVLQNLPGNALVGHSRNFHYFKPLLQSTRNRPSVETITTLKLDLRKKLGRDSVSDKDAIRKQHSRDEGVERHNNLADLVVWPKSTEECSIIASVCSENKIPMIPFGTGTGLESGVCAPYGGVSVDMSKMDQIVDFNPEDFDVTVQPGVTRKGLNHFLKDHGLWFPVDPGADASLCGMTATSASGTNAVRYGTMRENVLNVEVVLADGRVLHSAGENRRSKKTSAGFNLTNLFVGSEGCLGFITKSTLKIYGMPEMMLSAVCAFTTIKAAVDTCVQILQSNIPIARIELMDDVAMDMCNNHNKLDYKVAPTLFLEFHGSEDSVKSQAKFAGEIAAYNGGSEFRWAYETEDRNRLWKARHDIYWTTLQCNPGCRAIITDVCVPITSLPDLIAQTKIDIRESGVVGPCLGHVGDGNFHTFLVFNPNKPEEFKKAETLAARMTKRALDLNGTCTGEHGIGIGKMKYLEKEMGPVGIEMMKSIKKTLDPHWLMNPGKIFLSDY
ncbi:probable D-lactate dehydrogenase, mitochondrial [Daphnia carinata]|uniref:probable D-lactate dehydrogenase, mitochondrial n=1 Tax=Daphnia carinata TaxID=120202 RepID=UPI0025794D2F|nr:probable D-lactate dehydrogenase, mitochondrial [Daphnia carinata]